MLLKMLNSGVFHEINGCISTGKEANVYHAVTAEGEDLAVKVYKTSILVRPKSLHTLGYCLDAKWTLDHNTRPQGTQLTRPMRALTPAATC